MITLSVTVITIMIIIMIIVKSSYSSPEWTNGREVGVSCHSHTTGLACLVLSQAGDCVRRASGPSARVCLSSSRDREELPGFPEIPSEGASLPASLGRMEVETQRMVLYLNIADEFAVEKN